MTELSLFIRLKTSSPLSKKDAIAWYHCVKNNAPSGILGCIQTTNPQGDPDVVFMVHKETKGGTHYYEVPLTRDLTEKETDAIEDAYLGSEGEIETSSENVKTARQGPADAVVMDEEDYNHLCETLAKHQHQRWYDLRSKNGWSFGLQVDNQNKKHPMMRPWEQLPDQYKDIDYDMPNILMDMLVNSGYVVIQRNDLNKMMQKK